MSHVFNYDVPSHAEDYVHRIGRTGRAGRDGKAIMICVPRDEKNLADIESLVQREIPRIENPMGTALAPVEVEKSTRDEKPKRSRSRSRKKDSEIAPEAVPLEQKNPANEEKPPMSESPSRARGRDGRSRTGRGAERETNPVVGLGDHTPEFIGLSFKERSAG